MPKAKDLFNAYRNRSALLTIQEARSYDDLIADQSERMIKKDVQQFKVGDTATTTSLSVIKAGTKVVIKDLHYDGAYIRYLAGGVYHRAGDLE